MINCVHTWSFSLASILHVLIFVWNCMKKIYCFLFDCLCTETKNLEFRKSKFHKTLYELWTGREPNLTHQLSWHFNAFMHAAFIKQEKESSRDQMRIFIRYFLVEEQENGQVNEFDSRDVTFMKNEFPKLEKWIKISLSLRLKIMFN